MTSDKQLTHISKFLSLVLRHQPETIGIQLDQNGWTDVDELIEKANSNGIKFDRKRLITSLRQIQRKDLLLMKRLTK